MELKNFPMDRQSCPLIIGSCRYLPLSLSHTYLHPSLARADGYTNQQLVYEWQNQADAVSFVPGMTLNQFDLINMMYRNFTSTRREGDFSVLHVAFNLKRHTGYFLIQVREIPRSPILFHKLQLLLSRSLPGRSTCPAS